MKAIVQGGGRRGRSNAPYVPPIAAQQIVADGVWTWYNEPRAIYHDGKTYIGWVNSSGDVGVTEFTHATEAASSFTLRAAMGVDDHNNPALYMRSDGKLLAAYSKHNTDSTNRRRLATNAGSTAAFDAEQTLTDTEVCYNNLSYLSVPGRLFNEYRSGASTTRPRKRFVSTDEGSTFGAGASWINNTGARPYTKSCTNGSNRIDFLITTGHPRDVASSLYHAYLLVDAEGVETFYTSGGTSIGASIAPSDGTTVYDGTTVDGWNWDITYGEDGHPRVLFAKFPSTTDHRYMFSRWTGTEWTTPVEICAAGTYLYLAEDNYSGGMCFDGVNPDHVYVSVQVSGQWEIQEWRTADRGATWSKHRDITTGSSVKNCRPWSPRSHDGRLAVLWWRGTYTTYTNYSTTIWGAG